MTNLAITDFRVLDHKAQPRPTFRSTGNYRIDSQNYNWAVRDWRRAMEAKPRVYVAVVGESLLADFANRTSRPYNAWRPVVEAELRRRGYRFTRLAWSQNAGCSSCPCSPGFIIEGAETTGLDIWMDLAADAPQVTDAAAADHRAAQLAADPTIPLPVLAATPMADTRTYTLADFDTAN